MGTGLVALTQNMLQTHWHGYPVGVWTARAVAGIAATGAITAIALGIINIRSQYVYWKNSQISNIDCHLSQAINGKVHDLQHYRNVEQIGGQAVDQYCIAQALIQNGKSPHIEAREWLNKAAKQGLTLAKKVLCPTCMFPDWQSGRNFDEFIDICCPPPPPMVPAAWECPWDSDMQSDPYRWDQCPGNPQNRAELGKFSGAICEKLDLARFV